MNYAIIGLGFIYPRHLQAIEATGGQVLLTCDIDASKNPDFVDWVEMINDPKFQEVDTVVICTPNYLHSTITREVLKKGKKVLCEKPLSINGLDGLEGVSTVLQLRHHPELQELKPKDVYVEAKMFRDEKYWQSWKGKDYLSGGVLYNLGIHYIDLLVFLLGKPIMVWKASVTDKLATGEILFERGMGKFHIEIVDDRESQGRKLLADGQEIILSNQDNLSYEDLHVKVYEAFLEGKGVPLEEASISINLVKKCIEFARTV